MSAVAKDYVYQVRIDPEYQDQEPVISLETLKRYQSDVAKYRKQTDARQN